MLVVFPRRSKKPKSGDATSEERQTVTQHSGIILPIEPETMQQLETAEITEEMKVSHCSAVCSKSAPRSQGCRSTAAGRAKVSA